MQPIHHIFTACGVATLSVGMMQAQSKPNIILIITDQQSYNMIGALGNSEISTPNLDRLVNNGITFTNCYVANPLSVPSRFSLMTGASPAQNKIWGNNDKEVDIEGIKKAQANGMGHVFTQGGYKVFYGGKTHLPYSDGVKASKFLDPIGYGFNARYTRDEREELGVATAKIIREQKVGEPFLLVASYLNPHDICFETNDDVSEAINKGGRDAEKAETILAMRKLADQTEPSLYPTLPENFQPTIGATKDMRLSYKDFSNDYWRRYRYIYNRLVDLVDRQIGAILDEVDRSPFKDNTIIVFTSDHGEMNGSHQLTTKGVPYDECQRVPLVFCGKGIKAKQKESTMVCNGRDLLPTLCDLAGIQKPDTYKGVSMAKRIVGNQTLSTSRNLVIETQFSLVLIQDGKYKYTRFRTKGNPEMLIDLTADPLEKTNVINQSKYSKKLGELRKIIDQEINQNYPSFNNLSSK